MTQDRAKAGGEGESDVGLHLDLSDAGKLDFHRVFDGDDVLVGGVDLGERCVERRGLAATGGAGDQQDAVRPGDQLLEHAEQFVVEADALQVLEVLGSWQQTHDHAFAVGNGDGREAHVVVAARDLEPDATVLGQALLGDVETPHDLDARHDAGVERAGQGLHGLVEQVVDAKAHTDLALEGLDVYVAGAFLHRVLEQRVHQLDDRGVVGRFQQVLGLVADFLGQVVQVFGGVLGQGVGGSRSPVVDLVDGAQNGSLGRQLDLDFGALEQQAQVVEGLGVERVCHGHADGAIRLALKREHHVVLAEADRDLLDQLIVDPIRADTGSDRQVELLAHRFQDFVGVDPAFADQHVGQAPTALQLDLPGVGQLLLGEARGLEQDRAQIQTAAGLGRGHGGFAHGSGFSSGVWTSIVDEMPWARSSTRAACCASCSES